MKMPKITKIYYLILVIILIPNNELISGYSTHEEFYKNIAIRDRPISILVDALWNESRTLLNVDIISEQCEQALVGFKNGVEIGDEWALQMYDSSAHLQSGYLQGNIINYGNYEECLNVDKLKDSVEGQYCTAEFSVQNKSNTIRSQTYTAIYHSSTLAVCVPSNCTEGEIKLILMAHMQNQPTVSCIKKSETERKIENYQFFILSFFIMVALLIVTGSAFEFVAKDSLHFHKLLTGKISGIPLSFSVISNGKKLLKADAHEESIKCVHGLRFIAACGIIIVHRNLTDKQPFTNYFTVDKEITKWYHTFIMNAYLFVDVFFLISGLLISYSFLSRRSGETGFNPLSLLFHRYIRGVIIIWQNAWVTTLRETLRLTPALAVVTMIALLLNLMCKGYHCQTIVIPYEQGNCEDNWYYSLLYINNLIEIGTKCLPHTWYLTADMQLFVLSFTLLYILVNKPSIKYISFIVTILIIMNILAIYYLSRKHELKSIPIGTTSLLVKEAKYVYEPFYTRAGPWLIGFAVGTIIHQFNRRRFKMKKVFVAFGWILAIIFILSASLGMYPYIQYEFEHNQTQEYIYKSVYRNIWALGYGWIILACYVKKGGFINSFLSHPAFHPLSRLTYCLYLIHPLVQEIQYGDQIYPRQFSDRSQIYIYIGDLITSLFVALILHLAIEAPVLSLEKLFKNGKGEHHETNQLEVINTR